jgi:hypothetical protein
MAQRQGPVFIEEPCGCRVDHGIPHRCYLHRIGLEHEQREFAKLDADDQLWPPRENFPDWLDRQIVAAKAKYDAIKTPARRQRAWDAFLLLQGVKAEYQRRRFEK